MKKLIIILALIGLVFISCKEEPVIIYEITHKKYRFYPNGEFPNVDTTLVWQTDYLPDWPWGYKHAVKSIVFIDVVQIAKDEYSYKIL
jgi:hypothetical protein